METTSSNRLVLVSVNSYDKATHIAKILVTDQLASYCSVMPNISSFYSWNNSIMVNHDNLIIIRTSFELVASIEERINQLYQNDAIQIITLSIAEASESFFLWTKAVLESK